MEKVCVTHHPQHQSHLFYFGNKVLKQCEYQFYLPTKPTHSKGMIPLYFINTMNKSEEYANMIVDKITDNNNDHIVKTLWIFPEYVSPWNLVQISIVLKPKGIWIEEGKKSNSIYTFWAYNDLQRLKLYPLTMVIWPPARHLANSIKKDIEKEFTIIGDKTIRLPSNHSKLVQFVYDLYKDDVRCNKNNLVYKIEHFKQFPLYFRYFQILVKRPYLSSKGVSKTAIRIKHKIRGKYKKYLKNYFNDIIIHSSDNSKHSKSIIEIFSKV